MQLNFQSGLPLYLQIADEIEDAIFTGAFPEEEQIPSTTEISTQLTINPATVLKGMAVLVDQNILYKKRGVGMFVKAGAIKAIREKRQTSFYEGYIVPMAGEAHKLGLTLEALYQLVERGMRDEQN